MLNLDQQQLAEFCRSHRISRLSLFGSSARGDDQPGSDVDFLIEFRPGDYPGLREFDEIQAGLSALCSGRPVDLVNPKYLNHRLKGRILSEARVQYAEG